MEITLAGHRYTVVLDARGTIQQVACNGRWAMADVRFLDDWTREALQKLVDGSCRKLS